MGDYFMSNIEHTLTDSYEKSVIDFKPDQILKGMKVEMEHTNDPGIALEITMDHLTENQDYYDYLEDMESKFDNNKEE